MIQQLSNKYQKVTAAVLLTICFNGMILPTYGIGKFEKVFLSNSNTKYDYFDKGREEARKSFSNNEKKTIKKNIENQKNLEDKRVFSSDNEPSIGGPSQPEMSTFKSAGTGNLVNLFTGDFSYNIPLLDVGGYPVNIFYDGGVSMEQEASWVGLGWNINPGNVNRNMRGVPDDFNGKDLLKQTQTIKRNITLGVTLGADLEVVGIKDNPFSGSIGASLGVSFNNYLGPALDIGIRGNTGLSISSNAGTEKSAPQLGGSLSVNASSRSGVTFSPGISLTANAFKTNKGAAGGFGLKASTSYNSRSGIKAIQVSEQMSFNKKTVQTRKGKADRTVQGGLGENLASSSISFTKPSYVPAMRMPLTNSAFSGHFQLGGALFGVYPSAEVEVYKQISEVADADVAQTKPMVGYLYMQNAINNADAVMDFTRVNDNEVTPSTPIISAPQYSYDVFTIQGEGTGGSIRAYRNDEGYVRDNYTMSKDKNISLGADVGIPGHYGANFNTIKTPSTIGEWAAGNKLRSATGFKDADKSFENVYFRNPGETSVLNPDQYDRIGGADLVRYKLGGSDMSPTIEPVLEKFSKAGELIGTVNIPATLPVTERKKRSQVINFLTAEEASVIGLDKTIKSYNRVDVLNNQGILNYESFARYDNEMRKGHHISQINVTEANGQRYIYGIPVYNIVQRDFTFTVDNKESATDPDKVDFDPIEASLNSPNLAPAAQKDGYFQEMVTPPYAQSFLLSGLLSPDYVDVTGNGITEDDLGNAVKFNYTKIDGISKWRTPLTNGAKANFNAGKRTETKDDKGIVSYGERESWYLHSVESKTMIALFKIENRDDSKGSTSEFSGINSADNTAQRLKQIDLYSKADLKKNGLQGAKPIKTVHFEYSYALCKGTPNNTTGEGKLTLEKIYFTFNGQTRASKNQYVFSYGSATAENPGYAFNASDRWGTYKPASANPANSGLQEYPSNNLKNSDYPYGIQDKNQKAIIDQNAGAWMLKKILLPSGGQMEVTYESDDYAFVQNKRAAVMMQVLGFGISSSAITNQLYTINGTGIIENNYAFIKVPEACNNAQEVFRKYLSGVEQLSFKLAVNMPKGMEFLHSYATIDAGNYGVYTGDGTGTTIWVKLHLVDGLNPLSLTAIEFLREQLPGQAYPGYDVSGDEGLKQIGEILQGWFAGIKSAFKDPVSYLRQKGDARFVDVTKCFVRLNDPDGFKYGGGYRVKSLRLKDNWKPMNKGQLYTSEYGQDYDYTTKEIFNGAERTISSGVASYEPSLGGDENPFQTMVQVSNKVPLGPASYGAVEMPVLDAFFPASSVGYSKVTVTSIKKGIQDPAKKSRSGIGKQVTEFYTAKDFPVYYSNTVLDPGSDKQANSSSFGFFFYKYAFDSRALSQGFLVETNDMHGKLKSQASYPENDDKTPVNYTQNFYSNTGSNGMDEKFDFVYASQGGTISQGNMGIDIELMTDTREFSVKSKSLEIQGQVDLFPVIFPFWLPFIWPVFGESENTYRAVTSTKVITYHSILDSVVVIDKGSQVSTKNLVFDAETGDVIVNRTNNEFDQPVYTTNYPAWWAYSGMGLAYKNVDAIYAGVNFSDGKILNIPNQNDIFESGDELYLISSGNGTGACVPESAAAIKLWAFDKNKNTTSITNEAKDLVFMDDHGKLYTKNGVSLKIVRSGKRNMLSASVGSVVSLGNPIVDNKLKIDDASKVIDATAVEFKEKWQTDNDIFKTFSTIPDPIDPCNTIEVEDCNGYFENNINPYVKGLIGTFRAQQSKVFYDSRKEKEPLVKTNIADDGFLDNFKLYWDFNTLNNLIPDVDINSKWVWNSKITKINSKGLELETYNALNIYTAAQYGFNKTMPVAITNNSRYHEMFNEGFEDVDYNETLNGATINPCVKKHIDFEDLDNGNVVNTRMLSFNAHTGKKVLEVDAGSTLSKRLTVNNVDNLDYELVLKTDVTKSLTDLGGNYQFGPPAGDPLYLLTPTINFNQKSSVSLTLDFSTTNSHRTSYSAGTSFDFYIKISTAKIYYFNMNLNSEVRDNSNCQVYSNTISATISDLHGYSKNIFLSQDKTSPGISNKTDSAFLCPGLYKIQGSAGQNYQNTINPTDSYNGYSLGCTNCDSYDYKSLTTENGCSYTIPIAENQQMLNPIFTIPSDKKMLVSAWVREDCVIPCHKTDYDKSNIEIWSNGVNIGVGTIKRSGPIIEGWQKIEGEFTVPANATAAEIRFINTNNAPMYVDDIRIHPFNANMKSYVYDPVNLRLVAELDANNYATFYEYDDEGTLIRTKVETKEGIKTITETRSAKQKNINTIQ
jgi:hypothetical protein